MLVGRSRSLLSLLSESTGRIIPDKAEFSLDNGLIDLRKELCWLSHDTRVYRPSNVISTMMRMSPSTIRAYRNQLLGEGRLKGEEFIWNHSTICLNKSKGGIVVGYAKRLINMDVEDWDSTCDYTKLRSYLSKKLSSTRLKGFVRVGESVDVGFPKEILEFFINCMDYELRRRDFLESRMMLESERGVMVQSNDSKEGAEFELIPTIFDKDLGMIYPMSIKDYMIDVEWKKIRVTQPCFIEGCDSTSRITGVLKGTQVKERKRNVFMIDRGVDEISIDERVRWRVVGADENKLDVPVYTCSEGHLSPFIIKGQVRGFLLGKNTDLRSKIERLIQ